MKVLVVIPTKEEMKFFLQTCTEQGIQTEPAVVGKLPVTRLPELGITVAPGGAGKTQFAVQTQHLIDTGGGWDLVICAGVAGALVDGLSPGDVVISTETVEYDIQKLIVAFKLPRFKSDETARGSFMKASQKIDSFKVVSGAIASGDEMVFSVKRRKQIHELTGASVTAWEGAGGAHACQFSGVPFIEIRAVSDKANSLAVVDFFINLKKAMGNLALLLTCWARNDL